MWLTIFQQVWEWIVSPFGRQPSLLLAASCDGQTKWGRIDENSSSRRPIQVKFSRGSILLALCHPCEEVEHHVTAHSLFRRLGRTVGHDQESSMMTHAAFLMSLYRIQRFGPIIFILLERYFVQLAHFDHFVFTWLTTRSGLSRRWLPTVTIHNSKYHKSGL